MLSVVPAFAVSGMFIYFCQLSENQVKQISADLENQHGKIEE